MAGIGLSLFDLSFLVLAGSVPADPPPAGVAASDDLESYGGMSFLVGQNGGSLGWSSAWIGSGPSDDVTSRDDLESYSNSDNLDTKTGGTGFASAWVAR